ncbi:hypothetical protein [uncultured Senegalimassilia sp.]|uniref:hypothetical protein n=1 Tax=uncultured Senegalimassilia sp. TaxID=1714350 RepID=UPI0025FE300C|nr:hypothetical protein [uncultured Senegalimassilia sp.]
MGKVRHTVVRKGTSLVLVATLATGMVPAIALAQDTGSGDAPVAVQAEGQKEFNLEVGKAYSVGVTYDADSMADMVKTMIGKYFGDKVDVIAQENGTYNVVVSFVEYSDAIGDLTVNGTKVSQSADKTYTFNVASLDEPVKANIVIGGAMAGMFKDGIDYTMTFDTSTLPTKDAAADSYESGFAVYFKGQASDKVKGNFQEKVKVTPKDGKYRVELTANSLRSAAQDAELGDITYGGKTAEKVTHEDGSATYTLVLDSVNETYDFIFAYKIPSMNMEHSWPLQLVLDGGTYSGGTTDPGQDEQKVDKTALNKAIAAAKAIEQGKKTDKAFKALKEAIATAEEAAANDKIPQVGVDAVTEQLKAAVETFNTSKDAETSAPTPSEEETVTTADGFKLVAGKEYALPVSFINATTGEQSTAANFMEATATVSYADGSYSVTVTPNAQGKQFLTAMTYAGKAAVQNADGSFTVSGVPAIDKDITVSVTMPGGTVDMGVRLDTTSLPTASGEPVTPQPPAGNNGGSNGNDGNGGATTDPNGQQAEQGFQVGHTYQVPASWLKHNSTEESMAAKYFGDTALVRPQSDGTFKVSFSATSEGANHIISLAYNGSDLAKSGNQYTVSIPKADSDTVVPISMTIKEMEQLGGGAQIADMHLKLSQAKDLGTGQDDAVASSSKLLSQTGDSAAGVAGAAAVAAVAAGAAVVARRRMQRR